MTNSQTVLFCDRDRYPPREVSGFFTREDLERLAYQKRYSIPLSQVEEDRDKWKPVDAPRTQSVWFYEVSEEAFTLDAKRTERRGQNNDLWDALKNSKPVTILQQMLSSTTSPSMKRNAGAWSISARLKSSPMNPRC